MAYRTPVFASALTLDETLVVASGDDLNRVATTPLAPAAAPLAGVTRWAMAIYDFDVNGGTIGQHDLGIPVPDDAIVVGGFVEVLTTFNSAGAATVSGETEPGKSLFSGFGVGGLVAGEIVPMVDVAASAFKQTATRSIQFGIAAADLTAGRAALWVEYLVGHA